MQNRKKQLTLSLSLTKSSEAVDSDNTEDLFKDDRNVKPQNNFQKDEKDVAKR